MATQSMATRPPVPPFTRETAILKTRLAEDAWNSRDPEKVSLAYTPERRLSPFSLESGQRNWIIGSSRSYGPLPKIALPSVLHTSGMTMQGIGIARTETRIGSSMAMV